MSKSELVLPAGSTTVGSTLLQAFPADLLRDATTGVERVLVGGNFNLLGCAVGDAAHCAAHTEAKVDQGSRLLQEIAKLEDPQVALRLLRFCGGFAKLVHSMRCTPFDNHLEQLETFDAKVRATFGEFAGFCSSDAEWDQATLAVRFAGLGLRKTARHAAAAFLSSVVACREPCRELDPRFQLDFDDAVSGPGKALAAVNALLPEGRGLDSSTVFTCKQQVLSLRLDKAVFDQRLSTASSPAVKASLRSECEPGAYDFLQAVPSTKMGLTMNSAEFSTTLQTRLCQDVLPGDVWCPLCDCVLDTKGFHARLCAAGGERVVRQNSVRNCVFNAARSAGLRPELDKAGLLLPARLDDVDRTRRRPADVFLPAWLNGSPAALDFAVTAPQRQAVVYQAAENALASARAYAGTKRSFLDTEQLCRSSGIEFVPMVAESTGAWEPGALDVLRQVARTSALRSSRPAGTVFLELKQRLSLTIRRGLARALLRRLADAA